VRLKADQPVPRENGRICDEFGKQFVVPSDKMAMQGFSHRLVEGAAPPEQTTEAQKRRSSEMQCIYCKSYQN
jgi:hypothetical protein